MLSRINTLFCCAAILLHSSASGQVIQRTINWDKTEKTFANGKGEKVKVLSFHGSLAAEHDGFLPHYTENVRLQEYGDATVLLANEVYEPITSTAAKTDKVEETVKITVTPGMMRKVPYAIVDMVPLRKNPMTGRVEKLVKFSLKIEKTEKKAGYTHKSQQTFASGSVLATGSWYKVAVTTTGVYKLDYNFLKNTCGFDLSNINFSSIAVFGNGGGMVPEYNSAPRYDDLQENPGYIVDNNNNNRVDQGDYILFYAQGPHQWAYDSVNQIFAFTKNLYSDTNYYFITADQGTGKHIQPTASVVGGNAINIFDDYAAHQDDQINFLSSGKLWFGDQMNGLNPAYTINFSFPNIVNSSPVKFYSSVVASSLYNSSIGVQVNNGQQIATHYVSSTNLNEAYPNIYTQDVKSGAFTAPAGNFSLTYNFSNPDATGTSSGYIYQVVLNAKRALTFTGGFMFFRSIASAGAGNISQFNVAGASTTTHVWDVSDITAVREITGTLNNGTLSFTLPTPALKEFAAVDVSSSLPNPIGIGQVSNQNLHAVGQPNMLIITPDDLLDASNDLALFHASNDHLTVKVVTLNQIYNEYGSGRRDIAAIRDFIRMVYVKAPDSAHLPRYALLMGDGSFDPKDRVADNNNQFPTYQSPQSQNIASGSYTTDDFFGCLDPYEGGDMQNPYLMDLAVGRLPAASATEAQGMVDKIKLYKSSATLASWRNIVTFVSDEPWDYRGANPSPFNNEFEGDADGIADTIRVRQPAYNVAKIYCDAYQLQSTPGGGRYPDVNTAILNQVNTGTLLISYTGHGGPSNWANARIFNLSDIQTLQNHEKLPTFVTATCEFSRFDNPALKSAGEYLITNAQGGAAAMVTTVRPVYEGPNVTLQTSFFESYCFAPYQGRVPTIGEVLMQTKNATIAGTTYNTREFVLLGDPAMTLDYPQYNVVTTKIDNVPITQPHDTLKALKYVTISGEVRDWTGNKMTSFNGTCFPLIYDKLGTYSTLANYPGYPNFPYNAYKSIIFKGQCSVINGAFSFSFIVPKDINYAIGNGRLSYYADNGTTDANGYQNTGLIIGGASDSAITSKTGPVIKMYMNDDKFVYGGITDANPKLYAVLSDPYGINTTGNGLGHDMTCVIDANTQNPIVLNNYYQSALNNFRQGTVLYPFTNLATGPHTLKMKAWDILDNSAEDNTEFIVASSAKLALQHVFNYPNPFTTNTQFMFEHNRPGEDLTIMIQIFTVSGKLVKTIREQMVSTGYRVDNIRWDGLDEYGNKIGKGVYVYKVNVQDMEGGSANQFQKLVVLR